MGLTLAATETAWDDQPPSQRLTRAERRAQKRAGQPVATNSATEDALAEFIDGHRASPAGLPELARWDPAGRPESYAPEDLAQVATELEEALSRPLLPKAQIAALAEALSLVRHCQAEGLHLHVAPD